MRGGGTFGGTYWGGFKNKEKKEKKTNEVSQFDPSENIIVEL